MRVLKIMTALIASGMFFYVGVTEASVKREVIKTKAVSVSYKSPASAYKFAHKACQKHWRVDIKNIVTERPSFSVEIVTVNTKPRTVSALCISRKYTNDQVRRVARR